MLDLSVHDFDVLNWVLGTPKSVYARGQESRPGLWNDIHASLDYGGANGFVEGSEFMPQGYPFTCGLKVLCEGGVVEFTFRAGGVSVEMGGGSSLIVHEAGKAYPLVAKPGDAYQNQADYFVACVRDGRAPGWHARAGAPRRPYCQRGEAVVRDGRGRRDLKAFLRPQPRDSHEAASNAGRPPARSESRSKSGPAVGMSMSNTSAMTRVQPCRK